MVIFDSRIVHRYLRKMQDRVRRGQREPQLELGNQIPPQESTSQDEQPEILSVDPNGTNASASGVSPQQITVSDQEEQIPSIDTVPLSTPQDIKVPYSITVGLIIFGLFIISFIVIMVIRGVVNELPSLLRFFANIFLAGI